jgi:hypothetical protein
MEVKEASTWRRRRERVWKKKGQNLAERETSGKQNMGRDESAVDPASPSVTTVKEGCHKLNRVRHVVADKVGKEKPGQHLAHRELAGIKNLGAEVSSATIATTTVKLGLLATMPATAKWRGARRGKETQAEHKLESARSMLALRPDKFRQVRRVRKLAVSQ